MKKTLENLREEIDTLDNDLFEILRKRIEVVRRIGILKKTNNIQPLDKTRWQNVLNDKLEKAKKNNVSQNYIRDIFETIHKYSLEEEE